ncbi:MAG: hypothetical protein ABIP54_02215 [Candidatus Andersenbacteria bacterium]
MAGLNDKFVTGVSLNQYLVNKDTGAPLAFGTVEFYSDVDNITPKLVYQLVGSLGSYTYAPLSNPITLSSVGTIVDGSGNQIALYYYPFTGLPADNSDVVENYYIVVKNALGVPQFTRHAWPNVAAADAPGASSSVTENQVSNSQFVDVLFNPSIGMTINLTGAGTKTVAIAPSWSIFVTWTGTASVNITRTAIAGSAQYPTNPPYVLQVTGSPNISTLKLTQQLPNNPDIWSPSAALTNGYVSAGILLDAGSSLATGGVNYATSAGASIAGQTIITPNNTSGAPAYFNGSVQLVPADNPNTADTGYVNLNINLPVAGITKLTSVQVFGSASALSSVPYIQESVSRQQDHLFHYYNPLLQAKPIESFLVGWDFPFNPAQINTYTVAAIASGANTSNYYWDQTIGFQTATSGIAASQPANEALRITATNTTQFALIQYLPQIEARKILSNRFSVNLSGAASNAINGKVSVYYTKNTNLPAMGSNASLIATMDATGKPLTFNGTWVEVLRSDLGDAQFSLPAGTAFNSYGFNGWDMTTSATPADAIAATYIAIVVSFESLASTRTVDFNSISLVPGDIPTVPAPKTFDDTLAECRRYYQKSYQLQTLAGTASTLLGQKLAVMTFYITSGTASIASYPGSFDLDLMRTMRAVPTLTLYAPGSGTADRVDGYTNSGTPSLTADLVVNNLWVAPPTLTASNDRATYISKTPTSYYATGSGAVGSESYITYHFVAEARLGIVN